MMRRRIKKLKKMMMMKMQHECEKRIQCAPTERN
jgi:hypothetical protein